MRILFHSNAPWLKSGYGQQTAIWTTRLRDLGHDVAIHGYCGAQHLTVEWEGMTVYPAGVGNALGMDSLGYWYEQHQADVVISLCDAWALSPRLMSLMPAVCWTPVDAEPLSRGLADFFAQSGARPLAMSRYGQRIFAEGPSGDGSDGIAAGYIPHGIPTGLFKPPEDRDALRDASGFAPGTFVVGINQANRSGFRKALPEQIAAFARFWRRHPDSRLLLHMAMDDSKGQDLPLLLRKHGIPEGEGVVCFPDQGVYAGGVIGMEHMPLIYGAADVWMGCAMAGGFELPLIEAQACGTPVIATDCSAMTEVAGPHSWLVQGQPFWVEERHEGFWTMPFIHEIDAALEEAWQAREDGSIELRRQVGREHALKYDADVILRDYWVPYLDRLADDLGVNRAPRTARGAERTVWSPVMFRDELDMLDMRLHETDGLIDRHVIVEAETTHRGVPKPLYFRDSAGRFEAHASRITAVAGGALPDSKPWVNEHLQRDAAWTVIGAEAADEDVVLICDVDEIPSVSLLERARAGELPEVCAVRMRTTLHAVDWEVPADRVPPACVVATAGYIRRNGESLAAIRDKRDQYPVIDGGGWHFSWTGGPEAARVKLETATCHTELLGTPEGDLIAGGTRYRTSEDGGGLPVEPAEVDDTWPGWIRERKCPPSWFRPRDLSDAALIITAWRRPDYLRRVLDSWVHAEGAAALRRIMVALAPSDAEAEQRGVIAKAAAALGRDIEIRMDSPECARVPGPHRAIAEAANAVLADDPGCKFLIFGEEDVQVSSDVLSFIGWGREQAAGRAIAVCAHNALGNGWQRDAPDDTDADQSAARFCRSFSPWAWGTWRRMWERVLEPQWDYDCSSGSRPDQRGYDWQMQRITERCGDVLVPDAARSQNIGRDGGVFAHPEEFEWTQARSFREKREPVTYKLNGGGRM